MLFTHLFKEGNLIMKKEIKKEAEEKNEDWCPNCKIHVLGKDIGFGGHHKKCDHPVIQTCDIEEYLKINFFDKLPALPYKRPKKDNPVKKVNHEKYPEFKCIASYYYREEKDLFDKNVNIALSEGWKILDIKIIQESDRDGSYPIFCAIMGLWDCQQRRRNNMKYVDRFLKLNSAPDILEKCNRTLNCKEISENYAAISVIFKKYIKERGNADVLFLDVGCGYVPRLAIMMAHLTNWTCLAIDPVLRLKDYKTDRLWKIKSKLEDQIDFLTPQLKAHQIVIAAYVHSHAKENLLVPYCDLMVSIPCCFSSDFENIDRVDSFIDESILSPKNKVFVYNKSKEK